MGSSPLKSVRSFAHDANLQARIGDTWFGNAVEASGIEPEGVDRKPTLGTQPTPPPFRGWTGRHEGDDRPVLPSFSYERGSSESVPARNFRAYH